MTQLFGYGNELGWIVAKAALLFLTAVLGFRAAGRRTLSQMTGYDFVAAVAVGAIVGRVPNSTSTSYLEGAATLVAIFATHVVITRFRSRVGIHRVVDHPPWAVVTDGAVDDDVLRRAGLSRADLAAQLRRNGVASVRDVRFAVLEATGGLSVLTADSGRAGEDDLGGVWDVGAPR